MVNDRRNPGWDSQEIKRIAEEYFGGYAAMFKYHDWPERGSKMIPAALMRVLESYASVEDFVDRFPPKKLETAYIHSPSMKSDEMHDYRPELARIIRSLAYACLILLGVIMSGGIPIQGNSDGSYTIYIFTGREAFSNTAMIVVLVSVILLIFLIFFILTLSILYWKQRARSSVTSINKFDGQNNDMNKAFQMIKNLNSRINNLEEKHDSQKGD